MRQKWDRSANRCCHSFVPFSAIGRRRSGFGRLSAFTCGPAHRMAATWLRLVPSPAATTPSLRHFQARMPARWKMSWQAAVAVMTRRRGHRPNYPVCCRCARSTMISSATALRLGVAPSGNPPRAAPATTDVCAAEDSTLRDCRVPPSPPHLSAFTTRPNNALCCMKCWAWLKSRSATRLLRRACCHRSC